jgi:tyrosine-protein kinase Etk/Wzc
LLETLQSGSSTQTDRDMVQVDLRGLAQTVYRGRRRVLLATLAGLLLGIVLALLLPPYYEGRAVFLPPKDTDMLALSQSQGSAASLLLGGGTEKSDIYLGLLGSRSVADMVIDRTGLMQVYKAKKRVDAENTLARASTFKVTKSSLIQVSVTAKTAKLAADMTNAYMDALFELNGQMATSGSAFRKKFFEQQLDEQKKALEEAETALKDVQQSTGMVLPAGEAMAGINATAELQAQIGQAETQLAGLTAGSTEQNPDVIQARRQVTQLRLQLAQQQAAEDSKGLASNRSLPGLTLAYEQKAREVKLRMLLYDVMVKQYEQARLASIDPGPQLQVVDRAVVPEQKAGPSRRLLALGGMFLGLLIGLGVVAGALPMQQFRRWFSTSAPEDVR